MEEENPFASDEALGSVGPLLGTLIFFETTKR